MHFISPLAKISPLADLEDSTLGSKLVVGADCAIDSFVKVKFAGGRGDVVVGDRSHINSGTVIYSGNGVTIGNDVLVAANCTFAPANHEYARREVPMARQRFRLSKGGIIVEDDVWIGANCVILDGSVLRRGVIVGAMTLVRGELEAYAIYGGTPVRLLRRRPDTEKAMPEAEST